MSDEKPSAEELEAGEVSELAADEPPKSGVWIETCSVFEDVTDDELEAGRLEGETTDPNGSDEEPEL